MDARTLINLTRDVDALLVPEGDKVVLPKGQLVRLLQELGDSFTVMNPTGARFRVEGKDAEALGREVPKPQAVVAVDDRTPEGVEKGIWAQLKRIYDPEIPFNIVDVGLIYQVKLENLTERTYKVKVKMTLTAPGCGIGDVLVSDVYSKVGQVPGVKEVDVELTFDPPWDISKLAPAVRMQLNL